MYFYMTINVAKSLGGFRKQGVSCFLEYLQQAVGEWETWPRDHLVYLPITFAAANSTWQQRSNSCCWPTERCYSLTLLDAGSRIQLCFDQHSM